MDTIREKLIVVIRGLYGVEVMPSVTVAPTGQTFSDGREVEYASNVAMTLTKAVGKAPFVIAEEIAGALGEFKDIFTVEVAKPGFLNFILSDAYLVGKMGDFCQDFEGNISYDAYSGQTVICEFSDPNPFKVLHVGHLYTSIVGDAISRLFEYGGARVVRANFGGDVGLHVAKNIWAQMRHLDELETVMEKGLSERAEFMARCYVEGTRAYEEDEGAHAEITALNKEIYGIVSSADSSKQNQANELKVALVGDREGLLAKLYWWGRETSYEYFREFYKTIGVSFDKYYPESTVAERGLKEVKGHPEVYTESDGAIIYKGEEVGLHTRVFINKEGLPTYETKDVGLLFTKWDDYHFNRSVVITGNDIVEYMKVVLSSVGAYAPELVERTTHLTHGNVKLPGNEKMSSRKGNFLRATDVISMVREALAGTGHSGNEVVTMGAYKYAFLKYKIGGDIEFDVSSSVATSGNSGVYLQYSAVRAQKILVSLLGQDGQAPAQESLEHRLGRLPSLRGRAWPSSQGSLPFAKSPEDSCAGAWPLGAETGILEDCERGLIRKLLEYRWVLVEATDEMAPHKICNYLYELSQDFSRFYEKVKVVGGKNESFRGAEVALYLQVMTHGLSLLGIEVPEEM